MKGWRLTSTAGGEPSKSSVKRKERRERKEGGGGRGSRARRRRRRNEAAAAAQRKADELQRHRPQRGADFALAGSPPRAAIRRSHCAAAPRGGALARAVHEERKKYVNKARAVTEIYHRRHEQTP